MYNKKLLIILVIFSLIFSVGVVSASESNETSYLGDSFDNTLELTDLNQQMPEDIVGDELSEDNSLDIYVDENGDGVNGNGTMDNPFTTLNAAQNSEYKEIVNVNIFDGTYTLGSRLYFDTSNLNINGLGSNVVIKNLKDDTSAKQTISLVNANNGNLTMSNIILDASGWHRENQGSYYFTPFLNGAHNTMRFNNCTFIGYNSSGILHYASNNGKNSYNVYEFNGCKFINYTSINTNGIGLASQGNVTFVNCVFSADIMDLGMVCAEKVIFDSCWFGLNSIDKKNLMFYDVNGVPFTIIQEDIAEFTRYAIFTVYENYLGDNKYEIIGKLTWNGTNDTDGIDKLGPMIVYLSADNGIIPEIATLENGMFKVEYATESTSHEITARLDKQIIKLNNSVNFNLTSPIINYGDIQNITVYFQDNVKGTVYVTVNNKTYREFNDEQKVKVVSIEDILPIGTHDVVVKFESDNENDVITLGFNTTTISVNKGIPDVNISYDGDLIPDETLIVKAEMPGVEGNVTIIVNGNKNTTELVNDVATYTIDKLTAGSYYVIVLYEGSDLFDFAFATDSFDVVKSTVDLINDLNETIDDLAGQLKDAQDNATDLAGQLKDAQDNATDLAGQLKDAQDNATDLAGQLKDAQDNATDLAGQLKDAQDNATDLAGQLKDAQDNATDLAGQLKDAQDNATDLAGQLKDAQDNATDLAGQLKDAQDNATDLAGQLKDAQDNATDLAGQLKDAQDNATDLAGQLKDAQDNATDLAGQLKDAQDNATDLAGQLKDAQDNATDLAGQLKDAQDNATDLAGQLKDAQDNATDLAGQLKDAQDNATDLAGQLKDAQDNATDLAGQLKDAQDNATDLAGQLKDAQDNATDLAGQLKDAQDNATDLAGQLKDAQDNATDLAGQLKDAQDNATDLAGQLKDAQDNATDLAGQLKDAQDNATDLAGQLKDAQDNATDLAGQLKDANTTVNNQRSIIESQAKEINSLNATVIEQNKTINMASNPVTTSILVKDIATTATTAKYFIISLLDVNNAPLANKTVKFAVNGKTDSVVTNGSGVATVKVSYSTAGTRYYTFSFLGETGYSASIASAKVVVSKKATKLTAPKKTFKVNTKTKKVQVKLTSGKTVLKNKKVTLKVKGVTYTAKTNKKGIATFKITKLTKKGTSTYTVKFAGDKAYKAVNKNGKITIK